MKKIISKKDLANVKSFCNKFSDAAVNIENETGLSALALMAQIALETGWGEHILKVHDAITGKWINSRNLGNIKATNSWKGKKGWRKVPEWLNGKFVKIKQWFRVYPNYTEALMDYVILIANTKRYRKAWENRHKPKKYIKLIHKAGYATDPKYSKKIIFIMKKYLKEVTV